MSCFNSITFDYCWLQRETRAREYSWKSKRARKNKKKAHLSRKEPSLFTFTPPVLCSTNSHGFKRTEFSNILLFTCQFDLLGCSLCACEGVFLEEDRKLQGAKYSSCFRSFSRLGHTSSSTHSNLNYLAS